jgi:hypothetical protein
MTKQHFFGLIVALFATVSSTLAQQAPILNSGAKQKTYLTKNQKEFIIDDRVLGLVNNIQTTR